MRPDLILVDVLDSHGAAPADARNRCRALTDQGHSVRVLMLDPDPARAGAPSVPGFERLFSTEDLWHALDAARAAAPYARVMAAGSAAVASDVVARVGKQDFAGWWPTAIEGPDPVWWQTRPPLVQLPGAADGDVSNESQEIMTALDRAPLEPLGHARGRLPLWDGDYVLAPATPRNGVGDALIKSFARVSEEHAGLDLVFLAPPEPRLIELARQHGVGVRVHFADTATREAELAWYASAAAVVLASSKPFAACSLLRALACGAPVMAVGEGTRAVALRRWLMEQQLVTPAQCVPISSTSLRTVLERDDALETVLARGRALGLERARTVQRVSRRGAEAA